MDTKRTQQYKTQGLNAKMRSLVNKVVNGDKFKKYDAKMIGSNAKKGIFGFFIAMFTLLYCAWMIIRFPLAIAIYIVVWVISWIATILLPFMVLSLIVMFISKVVPGTTMLLNLFYIVVDLFVVASRVLVAEWLF